MMEEIKADEAAKGFDDIPTITPPHNYLVDMPSYLARMALEHGPVFKWRVPSKVQTFYGEWVVFMVGPEANRFVMHSHRDHFSHDAGWSPMFAGVFEKGLLNTDDPEHARERKMMTPAFAVAYMNAYLPIMERVIAGRTRDWVAHDKVDLYQEARKITFDVAAEALVGFEPGPAVDHLRELFYMLLRPDPMMVESRQEFIGRMARVRDEMNRMLLERIAQRRQVPSDDILGLLVQARDDAGLPFDDAQLLGQLHILLVAGHETTTALSAWLLYLLATHPDYLRRVHAEMDAVLAEADGSITLKAIKAARELGHAVDEAGRLRSPVANAPRGVVKDVVFGGYTIPAGVHVLLSLVACHRLPHVFANPDVFDPDRFAPSREEDKRTPYGLVTFGGGPRACIGMGFAQMEVKALAMHVFLNYTLEATNEERIVHAYDNIIASVVSGLIVRVKPRV